MSKILVANQNHPLVKMLQEIEKLLRENDCLLFVERDTILITFGEEDTYALVDVEDRQEVVGLPREIDSHKLVKQ